MIYKILADLMVALHFAWILFMLWGFVLTLYSVMRIYVLCRPTSFCRRFMDRWIFRTAHLTGIVFVALMPVLGKYCPLTVWEYNLRLRYDPALEYPGSFIMQWIERLVYPDVHPAVILVPTFFIALFTLLTYLLRPPLKIKDIFCKGNNPN